MTIARGLAERLHRINYDGISAEAIHWAKISIIDTIGVTLMGSLEQCVRAADQVSTGGESRGPSLLIGTNRRAMPLDAALINGTASHALDFDCTNDTFGGHPVVHLFPALLALAEARNSDGRAFLAAYVAGWETQARIARGAQPNHFYKGWFPTGTLGVFGTAAAAAHLLGLSEEQTAQALGMSASFASGLMANAGTMAKPLNAGHTARSGLMAALLVQAGATGAADAIEDRRGFLPLFNGAGQYDLDAILADQPLDLEQRGVAIKQYSCCGIAASSIDLMSRMVTEEGLRPEQVEHVEVLLHPQRLPHVNRPDPRTEIESRFSIHYCLARTLLQGRPRFEDFEGEAYLDPAIRPVMARFHAAPNPVLDPKAPLGEQMGSELQITLKDGSRRVVQVDEPLGRHTKNPMPLSMIEAKYRECGAKILGPRALERLLGLMQGMETLSTIRDLTDAMIPSEIPQAKSA